MGRNMRQENISEQYDKLKKYNIAIREFINSQPTHVVADSILNIIKENAGNGYDLDFSSPKTIVKIIDCLNKHIMKDKSFYLFMNTLFNKRGIPEKTKYSERMIALLVDSVLFDIHMECLTNNDKDSIRTIQTECKHISGEIPSISLLDEYENEEDYDLTDTLPKKYSTKNRGKYIFYLYMINRMSRLRNIHIHKKFSGMNHSIILKYIKGNTSLSDEYVELICLMHYMKYIRQLNESSVGVCDKLEYLYSVEEYQAKLCSVVYSVILEPIDRNDFIKKLSQYYDKSDFQSDIKNKLDKIRRNISNRRKTFNDNLRIQEYSLDILSEFFNNPDNIKTFQEMKKFLPMRCLDIEEELRKRILLLLKYIKQFNQNNMTNITQMYDLCSILYVDINGLFNELEQYDSKYQTYDYRIRNDMRKELANVLMTFVNYNGKKTTLAEIIQEGSGIFYAVNNYRYISKFDDVRTVLFIQYLKSLTFEYNFMEADDGVQLIISTLNCMIDYIRNIITNTFDCIYSHKTLSVETKKSLFDKAIKKYIHCTDKNNYQNLYVEWDTRTRHGRLDEMGDLTLLLFKRRHLIKKFL